MSFIGLHDPTSLGHLARAFANCSESAVAEAIERQALDPSVPIGALLVAIGAITPAAVDWLITKQAALRKSPSSRDVARLLDYTVERLGEETAKVTDFVRDMQRRNG